MKRLSFSLLVLASAWLASCEVPSDSATSIDRPAPSSHGGGGSTTAGVPVIGFSGESRLQNKYYNTIVLMDSNALTQTVVYTAGSATTTLSQPSWGPGGGAITFLKRQTTSGHDSIVTYDITTNASNIPSASNGHVAVTSTGGWYLNSPRWSSTAGTNQLAYATFDGWHTQLNVVSAGGGTPTTVWQTDTTFNHYPHCLGAPRWSPDDSRLAVYRLDSPDASGISRSTLIMIFNTSDWSCTDSIRINGSIFGLDWSPTDNELVFSTMNAGSYYIYYCAATNAATPVTYGAIGEPPSWSANASSVIFALGTTMYKSAAHSSTRSVVSTTLQTGQSAVNPRMLVWKR